MQYRALDKVLPVPARLYEQVERWDHLWFLNTRSTLELLRTIRRGATAPKKIDQFLHVIEHELGYPSPLQETPPPRRRPLCRRMSVARLMAPTACSSPWGRSSPGAVVLCAGPGRTPRLASQRVDAARGSRLPATARPGRRL
jgi:hypothetical protein